ncbi:small nucleolar ribonucleoprotein complex subunit putatrive [Cyclospora cayetanensis]|uniref:Small nucleolar ribonucleoprotein complex subunit putatrive n=1 Tax=Cyclospora cayetanensis TaxID=88456 RepID=A0A1D3CR58_9EIME|nr:small nucleolar ribonucleoprotein complex subunit putatrive [Cyclospora cayetanensis]
MSWYTESHSGYQVQEQAALPKRAVVAAAAECPCDPPHVPSCPCPRIPRRVFSTDSPPWTRAQQVDSQQQQQKQQQRQMAGGMGARRGRRANTVGPPRAKRAVPPSSDDDEEDVPEAFLDIAVSGSSGGSSTDSADSDEEKGCRELVESLQRQHDKQLPTGISPLTAAARKCDESAEGTLQLLREEDSEQTQRLPMHKQQLHLRKQQFDFAQRDASKWIPLVQQQRQRQQQQFGYTAAAAAAASTRTVQQAAALMRPQGFEQALLDAVNSCNTEQQQLQQEQALAPADPIRRRRGLDDRRALEKAAKGQQETDGMFCWSNVREFEEEEDASSDSGSGESEGEGSDEVATAILEADQQQLKEAEAYVASLLDGGGGLEALMNPTEAVAEAANKQAEAEAHLKRQREGHCDTSPSNPWLQQQKKSKGGSNAKAAPAPVSEGKSEPFKTLQDGLQDFVGLVPVLLGMMAKGSLFLRAPCFCCDCHDAALAVFVAGLLVQQAFVEGDEEAMFRAEAAEEAAEGKEEDYARACFSLHPLALRLYVLGMGKRYLPRFDCVSVQLPSYPVGERGQEPLPKYVQPEEYAAKMRQAVGPEWNSAMAHRRLIAPRVDVRVGAVVPPLQSAKLLEPEARETLLNLWTLKGSKKKKSRVRL